MAISRESIWDISYEEFHKIIHYRASELARWENIIDDKLRSARIFDKKITEIEIGINGHSDDLAEQIKKKYESAGWKVKLRVKYDKPSNKGISHTILVFS